MVKAFLAPKLKNDLDWMFKFLTLETSAFLAQMHFWVMPYGFYNFSVRVFFYLNLLSEFFYHVALNFRLLPLLKLF